MPKVNYSKRCFADFKKLRSIINGAKEENYLEKFVEYLKICYQIREYEPKLLEEVGSIFNAPRWLEVLCYLPFCFTSSYAENVRVMYKNVLIDDGHLGDILPNHKRYDKKLRKLLSSQGPIYGLLQEMAIEVHDIPYEEVHSYNITIIMGEHWRGVSIITPKFVAGRVFDETKVGIGGCFGDPPKIWTIEGLDNIKFFTDFWRSSTNDHLREFFSIQKKILNKHLSGSFDGKTFEVWDVYKYYHIGSKRFESCYRTSM